MEQKKTHNVKKDGAILFTGTENQCFMWLINHQSQSVSWACKYEGYSIEKIAKTGGAKW